MKTASIGFLLSACLAAGNPVTKKTNSSSTSKTYWCLDIELRGKETAEFCSVTLKTCEEVEEKLRTYGKAANVSAVGKCTYQ